MCRVVLILLEDKPDMSLLLFDIGGACRRPPLNLRLSRHGRTALHATMALALDAAAMQAGGSSH